MKIVPTVGRVVWYYPGKVEPGVLAGEGPLAAIVAHVWSDRMVNLTVFDGNGIPHALTSVDLAQAGDPVSGDGRYATWMPYQLGQAAKTEAAEAKAVTPLGIDPKKLAASIAQMVTEYVAFGIQYNSDWRSGLENIIEGRIRRILNIPAAAKPELSADDLRPGPMVRAPAPSASLVIEGDILGAFRHAAKDYQCQDVGMFVLEVFERPLGHLGYDVTVHYGSTLHGNVSKLEIAKR